MNYSKCTGSSRLQTIRVKLHISAWPQILDITRLLLLHLQRWCRGWKRLFQRDKGGPGLCREIVRSKISTNAPWGLMWFLVGAERLPAWFKFSPKREKRVKCGCAGGNAAQLLLFSISAGVRAHLPVQAIKSWEKAGKLPHFLTLKVEITTE